MAETNTSLGYQSKLQIVIVPSGKDYTTPDTKTGLLIFREGTNIIEVNGHEYQAAKTGDLSVITTALKNTGYLTAGSDGVLKANNPGTVAALLGTKIATSGDGKKTVSAWINDLQTKIDGINANISNLQGLTNTKGTGAFVVRDKSGEGTDFANTTAIQTAITDAKTDAISTAGSNADTKDAEVKKALIGNGKDSTSADSTPLKPGTNNTWAQSESNQKNLSHLKDLLVDLQSQLDTLSGTNLKEVKDTIAAIKQELVDGKGKGLDTIIDGLKVFLGANLNNTGATHTVGGTQSTYTLQQIINELEKQIKAVQSKHSVVQGGTGSASAKNYVVVTSSTTDEKTTYTVQTSTALDTAISNAKTTITPVTGTVGTTNYITVTKSTSGHDNYTITTTSALDTVATKAEGALPKGSSSYNDAAALESGLKGNYSSDDLNSETIGGAKKYADSKSAAAQSNAIKQAKSYADSVITWTVIS